MKFTIVSLAVVLFVSTASVADAAPAPERRLLPYRVDPSEENLLSDLEHFKTKTFGALQFISSEVANGLLQHAAQILTDGLRLQTNPQLESIFTNVSTEGIFQNIGDLILTRERESLIQKFPSQEGIISDLGPYFRLPGGRTHLHFYYNSSLSSEGPSHEGILGNLGGLALKGLGSIIGGTVGNVISGAGDVLGSLFFALPPQAGVSQEGIISKLGQSGILTGAGELLLRGATRAAQDLIRGIFKPYSDLLHGNIFLARGQFNRYPNIQAPGQEALLAARNLIHHHNFSNVNICVDAAEQNLTQLFDQYVQNGNICVNSSYSQGQPIVEQVFDIIIDAVNRVENAHSEASLCFKKLARKNRCRCFNFEVPALINAHSERFREYGEHLAEFVSQFSDLNTQFDSCLIRHLGLIRREAYRVVSNFHSCVEHHEVTNLPVVSVPEVSIPVA